MRRAHRHLRGDHPSGRDLVERLHWALARLRAASADLGETYESACNLIRHGSALPREGRWITGTPVP